MKLCFLGQTGNRINRINTKVFESVDDDDDGWMEKMHRIFQPPPALYSKDSDSIFHNIMSKFLPGCMVLHFSRH
jgi:hypothetical protein